MRAPPSEPHKSHDIRYPASSSSPTQRWSECGSLHETWNQRLSSLPVLPLTETQRRMVAYTLPITTHGFTSPPRMQIQSASSTASLNSSNATPASPTRPSRLRGLSYLRSYTRDHLHSYSTPRSEAPPLIRSTSSPGATSPNTSPRPQHTNTFERGSGSAIQSGENGWIPAIQGMWWESAGGWVRRDGSAGECSYVYRSIQCRADTILTGRKKRSGPNNINIDRHRGTRAQ